MFIDTHCHPFLSKKKSFADQCKNFTASGGKKMISIATDLEDSYTCIKLAEKYSFIYSSIGVHPCSIGFDGESLPLLLKRLKKGTNIAENVGILKDMYLNHKEKIIAIGECGLDYYWLESIAKEKNAKPSEVKELQKIYFQSQIFLAKELNLPFIIHNREAGEDLREILCSCNYGNFVLHSFSEDLKYANRCIEKFSNCMISFSGMLTFKNAKKIQATAKNIPLKNILIETDSPFLTPEPHRGKQENEPAFARHVLNKIIELRPETKQAIEKQIYQNSGNFFNLILN